MLKTSHSKLSISVPFLTVTVVILLTFYYIAHYDLLGPYNRFNDSNDYYILSALGIFDGTALPLVAHPGLNFMSHLSWFLFLLEKMSFVPVSSLSGLISSENSIQQLLSLFLAARIFGILTAALYLILVYLVTVKITKNSVVSGVLVLFNICSVGILEHMFMLRPELLSSVYIMLGAMLYLQYRNVRTVGKLLWVVLLAGFCIANSILAKIQAMCFFPLFVFFLFHFLKKDYQISRGVFVKYLLLFAPLTVLMIWGWTHGLDDSFILAVVREDKRSLASGLLWAVLKTMWTFTGALFIVSFLPVLKFKNSRRLQFCRNGILCFWGLLCGMLIPLYQFYLTSAEDKAAWAKHVVFEGLGETFYFVFLTNVVNTPALNSSFLFNAQFKYILSDIMFFSLIVATGFMVGPKRARLLLVFLCSSLWLCSLAFAASGHSRFVYYYQAYFLIIMTLALAVSMQAISGAGRKKWISAVVAASICLFAIDAKKAVNYRRELFARQEQEIPLLAGLDYWGGPLFEKVFASRFCQGIKTKEQCYQLVGSRYSGERDSYKKR